MEAFTETYFHRLPGHNRSFYHSESGHLMNPKNPSLNFKGFEVLSQNLELGLKSIFNTTHKNSELSVGEYLISVENKLPFCLLNHEAKNEFSIALELQKKAIRIDLELHIPLPLLLIKFSDHLVKRVSKLMKKFSSNPLIDSLINRGLYGFVYHYTSVPIRIANVIPISTKNDFLVNLGVKDIEQLSEKWINTFLDLFKLGVLPINSLPTLRGSYVDLNNSILNGGFCDFDTAVFINEMNKHEMKNAMLNSASMLSKSLCIIEGKLDHKYKDQLTKDILLKMKKITNGNKVYGA